MEIVRREVLNLRNRDFDHFFSCRCKSIRSGLVFSEVLGLNMKRSRNFPSCVFSGFLTSLDELTSNDTKKLKKSNPGSARQRIKKAGSFSRTNISAFKF
jgi:hypothetical protein